MRRSASGNCWYEGVACRYRYCRAGSEIAAFDAIATDGASVGNPTLVGVFSPGCPACEEKMPLFVDRAAGHDRDALDAGLIRVSETSSQVSMSSR